MVSRLVHAASVWWACRYQDSAGEDRVTGSTDLKGRDHGTGNFADRGSQHYPMLFGRHVAEVSVRQETVCL